MSAQRTLPRCDFGELGSRKSIGVVAVERTAHVGLEKWLQRSKDLCELEQVILA